MLRITRGWIGGAAIVLGALCCAIAQPAAQSQPAAGQVQPARVNDGVHSISLPLIPPPQFPQGPGKVQFEVSCSTCHSLRYITMQPRFSRKVWDAEVAKMINNYKAEIPPDQVRPIVDYLVSVHGPAPSR